MVQGCSFSSEAAPFRNRAIQSRFMSFLTAIGGFALIYRKWRQQIVGRFHHFFPGGLTHDFI